MLVWSYKSQYIFVTKSCPDRFMLNTGWQWKNNNFWDVSSIKMCMIHGKRIYKVHGISPHRVRMVCVNVRITCTSDEEICLVIQ